jgi:hypothetical protein
MPIATSKRFERMRERVNARLFNDTYRIYPYATIITETGAVSGQTSLGTPLQYNGQTDIPCRLDVARHFREEQVMGQEAVPGEFELHVPSDAPLKINHAVVIGSRRFEVVKEYDAGTDWSPDKYAIVADLRFGGDERDA